MEFWELTYEQAMAHCEHVTAREPHRLEWLARRVAETGGPLDELDASWTSLVPLWAWVVEYAAAGFPAVEDDILPSASVVAPVTLRTPEEELVRRGDVLGEALGHYVRLVLERCGMSVPWQVYVQEARVQEISHHATGYYLSSERSGFMEADLVLAICVSRARSGKHGGRAHTYLQELLMRRLGPGWSPGEQSRGASVLRPFLESPLPPMPDDVAVSPFVRLAWSKMSPDVREGRAFGDELTLAVGPRRGVEEDPSLLTPLDPVRLVRVLTAAGFAREDGSEFTAEDLLVDGAQVYGPDGVAYVEVHVADGAVRMLTLAPAGGGTASQWREIEQRLRNHAHNIDGHLVALGPEDWPQS